MTDTTIRPLNSMAGDEPLDMIHFVPKDVAEIVAAGMQKMRVIAQKAEDGHEISPDEARDYAVQSSLVQHTMLDWLRSDRCPIKDPAKSQLIAKGEELLASPAHSVIQMLGGMASNDD